MSLSGLINNPPAPTPSGSYTDLTDKPTLPSSPIVGTTEEQTLTHKRITERVSSVASVSGTLVWNSNNYDMYAITAQAGDLVIGADAGSPTDGQKMIFRIKDNGTEHDWTWTTGVAKSFRYFEAPMPDTNAGMTFYVECRYDASAQRWDLLSIRREFA